MPRAPKASSTKAAAAHPMYQDMIAEAIIADGSRTGTSRQAIVKYITENWNLSPEQVQLQLRQQMARLVENGTFIAVKASYRVSPEKRAAMKKKAAGPKKPAAKRATAKKPAAKRASAKKPAAKRASAKKPAAKKAGAKKPAAKKAGAKKPAAKKAAAKKPAAKKPAAKKPAPKKTLKRAGTMARTAGEGKGFLAHDRKHGGKPVSRSRR